STSSRETFSSSESAKLAARMAGMRTGGEWIHNGRTKSVEGSRGTFYPRMRNSFGEFHPAGRSWYYSLNWRYSLCATFSFPPASCPEFQDAREVEGGSQHECHLPALHQRKTARKDFHPYGLRV